MPNYLRNVDDTTSDPDLIAARYRAGRSAFFEVALTLAEQAENLKATSGASSGTGASTTAGSEGTVFPGGDPGDYGGFCFAGDTMILMANGTEKPIRDTVLYADVVVVPDESGKLEFGQVIHRSETMFDRWVKLTFEDGRVVEVRGNHRYRSARGEWVFASVLEHSVHLDETGHWSICNVTSVETVDQKGELDFYNLGVRHKSHAYVAAGDWVSNRKPQFEDFFEV